MATGIGKGAAGFPEAGSDSPVEFQDHKSLAALQTGELVT